MAKIVNNLDFYKTRFKPTASAKYEEKHEQGRHLVKTEKPKKIYDYYICDYCKGEIVIKDKSYEQTGGVMKIPQSLSNAEKVFYLSLCNKCVKPVVKEFEEFAQNKK